VAYTLYFRRKLQIRDVAEKQTPHFEKFQHYCAPTHSRKAPEVQLVVIVVIGLHGKVLVVGGALGVASLRSCEKLPPYLIEPMPASSKTDPSLAKAKPISNSGSASVITYLRRGKKMW